MEHGSRVASELRTGIGRGSLEQQEPYGATVHYLTILGDSPDGQPVFESIVKTKQGATLGAARPPDSLWKSGVTTRGRP